LIDPKKPTQQTSQRQKAIETIVVVVSTFYFNQKRVSCRQSDDDRNKQDFGQKEEPSETDIYSC
jgi:hypothetical protein